MSVVADRCVRCGTPLGEPSAAGLPTCDECREHLGEPQPANEPTRACPVDGSPMKKEVIHLVAIDRCPACRGVWLDGGELELINRAVASERGGEFATLLVLGIAV